MIPVRDPGLQAQRTALAWGRTALAVLVNAALALRAGLESRQLLVQALGGVLLLAAACVAIVGVMRADLLAQERPCAPASAAVLLVVGTTLLAALTAACAVMARWS